MEVARALCVAAAAGAVHAHVVVGGNVGTEVVVRRLRGHENKHEFDGAQTERGIQNQNVGSNLPICQD